MHLVFAHLARYHLENYLALNIRDFMYQKKRKKKEKPTSKRLRTETAVKVESEIAVVGFLNASLMAHSAFPYAATIDRFDFGIACCPEILASPKAVIEARSAGDGSFRNKSGKYQIMPCAP